MEECGGGQIWEHSMWESNEVWVRHGCGIWKSIMKVRADFWKFIRFKMGSGLEINFWVDVQVGDVPLKEKFVQ